MASVPLALPELGLLIGIVIGDPIHATATREKIIEGRLHGHIAGGRCASAGNGYGRSLRPYVRIDQRESRRAAATTPDKVSGVGNGHAVVARSKVASAPGVVAADGRREATAAINGVAWSCERP